MPFVVQEKGACCYVVIFTSAPLLHVFCSLYELLIRITFCILFGGFLLFADAHDVLMMSMEHGESLLKQDVDVISAAIKLN